MDKNEFNEWLQRHQKAYPALADWFAGLPDQKGTLSIWFEVLRWVEKSHADEATLRMIRGTEPLVRFTNWHDMPRFVTEHAECLKRDAKPRRTFTLPNADREETFACRDCHDTGIIDVFHGGDVKLVRKGKFMANALHRSARACTCREAQLRYKGMTEKGDLPIYNYTSDVRTPTDRTSCTSDSVDADIECITALAVSQPMSLDDWAASK
jgi:hypothetical protein